MYKNIIHISLLLIFILSIESVQCESLNVINEYSYDVDRSNNYYAISALIIDEDTLISCSANGINAKLGNSQPWKKIIDLISDDDFEDFMDDCKGEKKMWLLDSPTNIYKCQNSGEIIVFESICGHLLILKSNDEGVYSAQKWQKNFNNIRYNEVCLQSDMFVGTELYSKKFLVYGQIDQKRSFKRIFKYPSKLDRKLDSVSINYPYNSIPAFNPYDSTFWLAFWGYDYVYIINKKGKLLDSLPFSSTDYIAPTTPVSRLKSQAVHSDWLSKWTPVKVFKYVPPGYFILQFMKGWDVVDVDSLPLYGTLMWTADRKPTELELDPHWQLAGVQPDGRIIFANYQIVEGQRKIVLHVARIVP